MFDWITALVQETGYVGIAFLMLAENVFPPIPSELIMPLAGFTAARGDLTLAFIILAGTIGSVLGALFWYYVGLLIGVDRLKRWAALRGRWLTLTPEDVDRAQAFFARHQAVAIFVGRLIPAIRSLISVPAGVNRMAMPVFLFWTTLGTSLWTTFLAGAGYLLESSYVLVADYLNPVSNVVVVVLVVGYLYRVANFRSARP